MVYLGVDLHRKVSHVIALDDAGEIRLERRFANSPAEFRRVFGELAPAPAEVVFEATYGWGWFADLLADAGVPVTVADLFGPAGRRLLQGLALRPISAARLAASLRLIDDLGREILATDRELVELYRGDERIRRLTPILGAAFSPPPRSSPRSARRPASARPSSSPPGPGSPPPSAARPSTPAAGTSASRAAAGCAGPWWRRRPRSAGPPSSTASPIRSSAAEASRSPGSRSPAGCSPWPSMPSATRPAAGPIRRFVVSPVRSRRARRGDMASS